MDAFTAITRFGLGPDAGDLGRAEPDPRGYVLAQLVPPAPVPDPIAALPPLETIARDYLSAAATLRRAIRDARKNPAALAEGGPVETVRRERNVVLRTIMRAEIDGRVGAALSTSRPLVERLVLFFANHFSVSRTNTTIPVLAGNYERSLRPFVLGRFRDLLGAAVLHPAMLSYLDNTASVGPNSPAGRRRGASYNENLARELLELHTLGVDGGYTQDDVIALALVLTGWTGGFDVRMQDPPEAQGLGPPFRRALHEPGPKTILGRTYRGTGAGEIEAVLDDLAVHPATARHVSGKLARHFVGDGVSEATVARLTDVFLATGGDIAAVMTALVSTDEAWTAPPRKVISPYDFVVSAFRGFGQPYNYGALNQGLTALGHPMWRAPAPTGWPDGDTAWISGDTLLERIDWATAFAGRAAPRRPDIAADARALLGAAAGDELMTAIARAEGRTQAMTLLLMSPQWQVR